MIVLLLFLYLKNNSHFFTKFSLVFFLTFNNPLAVFAIASLITTLDVFYRIDLISLSNSLLITFVLISCYNEFKLFKTFVKIPKFAIIGSYLFISFFQIKDHLILIKENLNLDYNFLFNTTNPELKLIKEMHLLSNKKNLYYIYKEPLYNLIHQPNNYSYNLLAVIDNTKLPPKDYTEAKEDYTVIIEKMQENTINANSLPITFETFLDDIFKLNNY